MGYTVEKNYTERYEIEKVKTNFMSYKRFSAVRKDIPNCELCDKGFQDSDNTNLAFAKKTTNKLICDECASKTIEGGAESINW
ncbi:hypothetical protein [Psychrobacillus sp. FSL K6-1267]|uniref:hypothetical protein n=1 Tax=Psychrobacillus sp. FSL K6-1267 TaxID=2921543 RepID=UPI0030F6FA54